ncbi:MAG: DUF2141 domain-containing protein [Treponema sp.]|nr:DUF2141 domain-containing protein [Treponema sp.]
MRKLICFLLLGFAFSYYCTAQAVNNITIEINNVVINGGTVYIGIFSTAESFSREEPDFLFELEAINTTMVQKLSLPGGEYVISAIQDANNNKRMDFGLFGIPRELFGISNYNGRGFPSRNFDRQKILIDRTTEKIIINLYGF